MPSAMICRCARARSRASARLKSWKEPRPISRWRLFSKKAQHPRARDVLTVALCPALHLKVKAAAVMVEARLPETGDLLGVEAVPLPTRRLP
jgi:hypothetical protein